MRFTTDDLLSPCFCDSGKTLATCCFVTLIRRRERSRWLRREGRLLEQHNADLKASNAGMKRATELVEATVAEVERLRRLNESLVSRMAAMCEVLCRKANKLPATCPHCGGEINFVNQEQET